MSDTIEQTVAQDTDAVATPFDTDAVATPLDTAALLDKLDRIASDLARGDQDIVAGSLTALADDIRELRVQLSVTNKAALASAKSVQNMGAVLSNRLAEQAAESSRKRERGIKPSALVMTSGTLLMSWALMFYLKTGSVNLALLGLVLVNIAGCAAVLLSRSED